MEFSKLKDAVKKYWILCLVLFVVTGGCLTVLFKHRANTIVPPSYTITGLITVNCGDENIASDKEVRNKANFGASNMSMYLQNPVVLNTLQDEIDEANVRIKDIDTRFSMNILTFDIKGSNEDTLVKLAQTLVETSAKKANLDSNDYTYEYVVNKIGGEAVGGFKKYLPIIALVSILVPVSAAWVLDSDTKKK